MLTLTADRIAQWAIACNDRLLRLERGGSVPYREGGRNRLIYLANTFGDRLCKDTYRDSWDEFTRHLCKLALRLKSQVFSMEGSATSRDFILAFLGEWGFNLKEQAWINSVQEKVLQAIEAGDLSHLVALLAELYLPPIRCTERLAIPHKCKKSITTRSSPWRRLAREIASSKPAPVTTGKHPTRAPVSEDDRSNADASGTWWTSAFKSAGLVTVLGTVLMGSLALPWSRFETGVRILGLGAVSAICCAVLIPVLASLARQIGWLQADDTSRRLPIGIPLSGGLAVFTAGSTVSLLAIWKGSSEFSLGGIPLLPLFLACLVFLVFGILDDRFRFGGVGQIIGQGIALLIIVYGGFRIEAVTIGSLSFPFGMIGIPLTLCWLLITTNSYRFLDGMEGVVAQLGLVTAAGSCIVAVILGQTQAIYLGIIVIGALLVVVVQGFTSGACLLGSSGTSLVAFLVSILAVESSKAPDHKVSLVIAAAIVAVPMFDTAMAFLRRMVSRRSILKSDHGHLYSRLLLAGCPVFLIGPAMAALCGVSCFGAIGTAATGNPVFAFIATGAVLTGLVAWKILGFLEFVAAGERVASFGKVLLREPFRELPSRSESALRTESDWLTIWNRVAAGASIVGLRSVTLHMNAESPGLNFHSGWGDETEILSLAGISRWHARIPLLDGTKEVGLLEIVGDRDDKATDGHLMLALATLESILWDGWTVRLADDLRAVGAVRGFTSNDTFEFEVKMGKRLYEGWFRKRGSKGEAGLLLSRRQEIRSCST